jgi:dipeptidyl aminopeptidase/acylaminoacyl peptidase
MVKVKALFSLFVMAGSLQAGRFSIRDLQRLRSVGDVRLSPGGRQIAYTVSYNDVPGKPYSQLFVMTIATGASVRIGKGSAPDWSPDGAWIAYSADNSLMIVKPDGAGARKIGPLTGTNAPLPSTGKTHTWSPDGKRIAFVSAVPGPETADATGDPVVITRYLYKPDADEGMSHFNDNKRLKIFLADVTNGTVKQLTFGNHYEHSIEWSPRGDEIIFVSNREENEDQFFNYDLFALKVADGGMRRLTATENIEYRPRWSPDGARIVYQGCKRGLTDLETTMEDTHLWIMNADGAGRHEFVSLDARQGPPEWSGEGDSVYFTAQERGNVKLYRQPAAGGKPEPVVNEPGTVGSFSIGRGGAVAYAFTSPSDMAQLYLKEGAGPARKLTNLNAELMSDREIAPVESFTFISNDNKWEVEAFLTRPLGMTKDSKHPMIAVIHGGPHGQQGPAFTLRSQVFAARGWATLMVNYRGSTGYGQAFADGVFGDQNGNEAQDVIYGVSAAIRRNLWVDRDRLAVEGVSYGGQLSMWLVTQTRMFKSAIPTAGISNLVSYNYTTYYNQYEQMTFGLFPHQGNLMDVLWERSALKHVAKVATPTLLVHGENDNDVPIMEAEQYFVALKDVGVDTVFLRYPREGHGLKEVKHIIDWTERSIQWHERNFAGGK